MWLLPLSWHELVVLWTCGRPLLGQLQKSAMEHLLDLHFATSLSYDVLLYNCEFRSYYQLLILITQKLCLYAFMDTFLVIIFACLQLALFDISNLAYLSTFFGFYVGSYLFLRGWLSCPWVLYFGTSACHRQWANSLICKRPISLLVSKWDTNLIFYWLLSSGKIGRMHFNCITRIAVVSHSVLYLNRRSTFLFWFSFHFGCFLLVYRYFCWYWAQWFFFFWEEASCMLNESQVKIICCD